MRINTKKTRKVEKIVTENGCVTVIKGAKGEIIQVDELLRDHIESRNWSLQAHKDRKGKKCKPYAMGRDGYGYIYMHRYLWTTVYGPIPPGLELDHINGDTLDNRMSNLRLVTHKENMNNQKQHRYTLTQLATSL